MTPFYTRATLAELLNVSTKTIDRWCKARKLPFHQLGRFKRFTYGDLNAFLESRSIPHGHSQGSI